MPNVAVETATAAYPAVVERGCLTRVAEYVPERAGKVFVVTTEDVWYLHNSVFSDLRHTALFFPGGEPRKRLTEVEKLAEQMVQHGADRTSVVVGFGGGIVTDVAGFLAATFMRGIPVIQAPTTLLAQVDAAVGGKTGVNLVSGKNLMGSFHQPLAVLIDPMVLSTLPPREYRAGLYEIIKAGVIRSPKLFELFRTERDAILAQRPEIVDRIITEAVRIKAEVVSADEKEGDLRRILNFGHTIGHALEAETNYSRLLHGEAVAFGMRAATHLARRTGDLSADDAATIVRVIKEYGSLPGLDGVTAAALVARLGSDKKTIQGRVHWVLPTGIGTVRIKSGVEESLVTQAIEDAFRD